MLFRSGGLTVILPVIMVVGRDVGVIIISIAVVVVMVVVVASL